MFAGNLTILGLCCNHIKVLENMLFLHFQALEEIDSSHNEISWIHENVFEGISKNLTEIDLRYNKLVTIQEDSQQMIFALPQIESVNIHQTFWASVVLPNQRQ